MDGSRPSTAGRGIPNQEYTESGWEEFGFPPTAKGGARQIRTKPIVLRPGGNTDRRGSAGFLDPVMTPD